MNLYWRFRIRTLMFGLAVAGLQFAGPVINDAAGAALPKEPCALLKPTEIQAALAPTANIGKGVSDTGGLPMVVGCTYSWGSRNTEWGQTAVSVIVTDASKVQLGGLSSNDIKQRVIVEAKAGGPNASVIPGIGDGAVFTTNLKTHDAMAKAYVVKGKGVLLLVTFHGGNALAQKDKIIALLKTVAARL